MHSEKTVLKFGLFSASVTIVLTIVTWGLGMMAVPPAGPYCPGDCMGYPFDELISYYPRDYYWMYLAVFQLFSYLIFINSIHYISKSEIKIFSSISASFAIISVTVLLIAYFVQFSVVPISMMHGEKEGIALITQYNGHGVFIAMEDLGYITMSISFLFLGFVFTKHNRLEKAIRIVLICAFILTVLSFIYYSFRFGIDRSYRFEVAAITINWLTLITAGILISIYIKKRLRSSSDGYKANEV